MNWIETGTLASKSLRPARLQLHYGALILGSAAHSLIEHASDDSHTNLALSPKGDDLSTRFLDKDASLRLSLELSTLNLVVFQGSEAHARYELVGHSAAEALAWVQAKVASLSGEQRELTLRTYDDFPSSPLGAGGHFAALNDPALSELGHWFANAQALMNSLRAKHPKLSELRVWPHHLDLGGLLPLDGGDDHMLGLGLSPGDDNYDQPYFYTSPYPQPTSDTRLPELSVGHWHSQGFIAAIATADELLAAPSPKDAAESYLRSALAAGVRLISQAGA